MADFTTNMRRGTQANAVEADPLVDAIQALRDGAAAFEAIDEGEWPLHGGEDAVIENTYAAPLAAIENWQEPAQTLAGAIEALRLAHKDALNFDTSPVVTAMVAAALAYFDAEGTAPSPSPSRVKTPPALEETPSLPAGTLLNTAEAGKYLRASKPTLDRWRSTGKGPVYIKRGGQIFYRYGDIESYLTESLRQATRDSE